MIEKTNFLGLSISIFDRKQLIKYIEDTVNEDNQKVLYGHALWTIPMMKRFPDIYNYGELADLLVTDGRPFYLLAKWHGLPLKYDISIPNLVSLTLELAHINKWSIFLLGATDSNNNQAIRNVSNNYPNIKFVKGRNGYFSDQENDNIISQINLYQPNILIIGITSPKKERIAAEWRDHLKSNIIIPCGGMIDVLAGKTKVTPNWIKKLGLASFYRVIQEPLRLFKRYNYIYSYLFFKFLPLYFFEVIIKKNKSFSLAKHLKIID